MSGSVNGSMSGPGRRGRAAEAEPGPVNGPDRQGTALGRFLAALFASRAARLTCTIVLTLVIGVIVFDPDPGEGSSFFSTPALEFSANIVMFLPVGAVAWWWRRSVWRNVLVGFVATVIIESVQGLFLPHRVADIRDVIANTSGAVIGSVTCWVVAGILLRKDLRNHSGG